MYFESRSSHTSDRTLSHLGCSRVQYGDMLTTLQGVGDVYDTERNALLHGYQQLYDKWMYEIWYVLFHFFVYYLYMYTMSQKPPTFDLL